MYLPFSLGGQMINNEYECEVEKTLLENGYDVIPHFDIDTYCILTAN